MTPRLDREAHRRSHPFGVLRLRNRRVHQNGVHTQFHRDRCVARRADARVNDDRRVGQLLAHDRQVRGVLDAESRPDGRGKRHHRGAPGVEQFFRHDEVVAKIWQHGEALAHQHARGL